MRRKGLEGLRDRWAAVADLPLPDVEEHREEEVFAPLLLVTTSAGAFLGRGGALQASSRAEIEAAAHRLETIRESLSLAGQAHVDRVIELARELLRSS